MDAVAEDYAAWDKEQQKQPQFETGFLVWFQYANEDRWMLASGTHSLIGAKMRCTNMAKRMTAGGEQGRVLVTSLIHFPDGSVESSMVYVRESAPAPKAAVKRGTVSDWLRSGAGHE